MAKKLLNDILVNDSKSVRRINIEKVPRKRLPALSEISPEIPPIKREPKVFKLKNVRREINPQFFIWVVAIISLVALFFGISLVFSKVTIEVTAKKTPVQFDNTVYNAHLNSSSTNYLSYEVMTLKKDEFATIESTEEKQVNQKATGKVMLYNEYSSSAQRLITNTRLASADGRIYRLVSTTIVPGYKKVSGKIVPGSIETNVIADQAGDKYNLKISDLAGDFKIPSFKGSPRYNSFYGRISKDITGGFIGTQKVIADDVLSKTIDQLKKDLQAEIIKEMYAVRPDSYIIFNDLYYINFERLPDGSDGSSAKIGMRATLNGLIFNSQKIAEYVLLQTKIASSTNQVEFIPDDNLVLQVKNTNTNKPYAENSLQISFTGKGEIKWLYNEKQLKIDLAGKSASAIPKVLNKYSAQISDIKVYFRPIWQRYIPEDTAKIFIKEKTD
ncbi:MAG: hypothetical protein WCO10_01170 [bacterium]